MKICRTIVISKRTDLSPIDKKRGRMATACRTSTSSNRCRKRWSQAAPTKEEVRNEDGGMLLTFEGWGNLADGTRESIHREKRLGFTITNNIEKRERSAAEMIESFEKH